MPKVLPSPSEVVLLWVTQGKTDHMAKLEDANVLSKIQEQRASSSSTFSILSLSVSDLVPNESTMVAVRWSSTNQKDFVEASTIRFRDLESEGRSSRRRGGRTSTAPPQSASNGRKTKNSKKLKTSTNSSTTKTDVPLPPKKRRKRLSEQVATTKIDSVETSANSSIVTREGRDDDVSSLEQQSIDTKDSKPLPESKIETIEKNQNHSISNPNAIAKTAPVENDNTTQKSSETTETNCREISSSQNQNVIDLEDEDFDSSDDEAIEYRMNIKNERNKVKIEQEEKSNTSADVKNNNKPRDDRTAASSGSNRENAHRKRKRITISSELESDDDYIDSESESFSAPTEASSRRERRRYPNGFDSQEDDDEDDRESPPDNGKMNTSNWERMKRLFRGENWA